MKQIIPIIFLTVMLMSCQTKPSGNDESADQAVQVSFEEIWHSDSVMKTPESVIYDPKRNVLYVANMNRVEEGDDTGFLTKLSTDGSVLELHWIDGLNEPRGMGIYGDLLFATDHNRLIIVDLQEGELKETIPVEGAKFLNDLAITKDGVVYFTDSETGKAQIYEDGEISTWIPDLNRPNGLFDDGKDMLVSESSAKKVWRVNKENGAKELMVEGFGVDGIEYTGISDYYIISEWGGRIAVVGNDTVYTVHDTREAKINTADIGYNSENKMVYVPTFFDNRVVAYQLTIE